jgi:hypothetical protein
MVLSTAVVTVAIWVLVTIDVVSLITICAVVYVDVTVMISLTAIVWIDGIVTVCGDTGGLETKPAANARTATTMIAITAPLEIPLVTLNHFTYFT